MASTRARKSITAKTRAEDDRLRELLRHDAIAKLKKLMTPLIERRDETSQPTKRKTESKTRHYRLSKLPFRDQFGSYK